MKSKIKYSFLRFRFSKGLLLQCVLWFILNELNIKTINEVLCQMEVIIGDRKLEKILKSEKEMQRKYGINEAKKLKLRLQSLYEAENLKELENTPGRFHELRENRKGEWACSLDKRFRLIFVPTEKPIPVNESGQYIWEAIRSVTIIEIVDYHK